MGVLQPRDRSLLSTSNPDMSGKPISSMTRLQGSVSVRKRAVSPSFALSAAWPAALRSAMIPLDSAGSSSTSRILAMKYPPLVVSPVDPTYTSVGCVLQAIPLTIAGSADGAVRGQRIGTEIAVLQPSAP